MFDDFALPQGTVMTVPQYQLPNGTHQCESESAPDHHCHCEAAGRGNLLIRRTDQESAEDKHRSWPPCQRGPPINCYGNLWAGDSAVRFCEFALVFGEFVLPAANPSDLAALGHLPLTREALGVVVFATSPRISHNFHLFPCVSAIFAVT